MIEQGKTFYSETFGIKSTEKVEIGICRDLHVAGTQGGLSSLSAFTLGWAGEVLT